SCLQRADQHIGGEPYHYQSKHTRQYKHVYRILREHAHRAHHPHLAGLPDRRIDMHAGLVTRAAFIQYQHHFTALQTLQLLAIQMQGIEIHSRQWKAEMPPYTFEFSVPLGKRILAQFVQDQQRSGTRLLLGHLGHASRNKPWLSRKLEVDIRMATLLIKPHDHLTARQVQCFLLIEIGVTGIQQLDLGTNQSRQHLAPALQLLICLLTLQTTSHQVESATRHTFAIHLCTHGIDQVNTEIGDDTDQDDHQCNAAVNAEENTVHGSAVAEVGNKQ